MEKITMDYTYHGVQFENGWEHNAYTVELTHNGVTEEFDWKQGMGVEGAPKLDDVLACLMLDVHYYEEDIYSMYDNEEDAKNVITQLEKQAKKVNNLFTEDEQSDLVEYYEEW